MIQPGMPMPMPRGTQKKSGGPLRGWLVPPRPKKYQGWSDFVSRFFYRVFELPSPRNAQKRDKNKIEKQSVWFFFVDFFVKIVKTFRHDFLVKRFL
jgi:hypothetical protein